MSSALLSSLDREHELVFFDTIESFTSTVAIESEALLRAAPSIHSGQQDVCNRLLYLVKTVVFIGRTIVLVMNAAVTIFGLGVGVGLILGDTLRGRSASSIDLRQQDIGSSTAGAAAGAAAGDMGVARMPEQNDTASSSSSNSPSWSSLPSEVTTTCGTRLRRTNRVESPPQSKRAAMLPAQ